MEAFAELLNRLAYTPGRNAKLSLLSRYFQAAPDPDRGWALAALTDGLPFSFPVRKIIQTLIVERVDEELFRLSRDYVGDTAETVALLWDEDGEAAGAPPNISEIVAALELADRENLPGLIEGWLNRLDANGRWALLKLLTGALRIGVSARLAKTAIAQAWQRDVSEIEEIWHGIAPPYSALFAWLDGKAAAPDVSQAAVFRPLMLANPLEPGDLESLDLTEFAVEWKWDGIRVQVVAKAGEVKIFSRTGDDISRSFPELTVGLRFDGVVDGELLVVRDGNVAPFSDLQQRLNRKTVSKAMLRNYPAHVRLYDVLELAGSDVRRESFETRRDALIAWHDDVAPPLTDVSELLTIADKDALSQIWQQTRASAIEGLMLKRRASPYIAGRPKGHWFKWKRAPLTIDCVMMYAQRGSGRRSSYYSDYTFGTWRPTSDGALELVPVGKAYSGFSDEELLQLDRWVRTHTIDRFGPVRSVTAGLVLEVAFDSVHYSKRHKSGVAMRFPRIHRIRWDKPAEEADDLETLVALIVE
ncbi:MAG: cisplatin damage response ATP-dependent DNA ligase [Hyphomicrobiaceae bacterium]